MKVTVLKMRRALRKLTRNGYVINPFVSEAQRRACYDAHAPGWDCSEWESKTKGELPSRKRKKRPTTNARRRRSLLKVDPTRTITLRRQLTADMRRRFARLRIKLRKLIVEDDAFGLVKLAHNSLAAIHRAVLETDTNPTPAQIEAGNYRKGRVDIQGLPITIETPAGYKRKPWHEKPLAHHYGYVRRTLGSEASDDGDGEHVDVFLGPNPDSERVFVVTQNKPDGSFDEYKCMVGFDSAEAADRAYHVNYSSDWQGFGGIKAMSMDEFKAWIKPMVANDARERYQFLSKPEQIEAFQQWLAEQFDADLTGTEAEQLWERYARVGWQKGAGRAFDDVRASDAAQAAGFADKLAFHAGTREQFLRSAFSRPVAVEKIKLLAGRAFDDLENVTADMSTRMSRTLADGLVAGKSPREVAKDLDDDLDIGRGRAETISRTELIRAHSEGQLDALKDLGVTEVGVQVEWATAGDDRVCEDCADMEGEVFSIEDAHGMIPRHPNCRCAWIPSGEALETDDE